MIAAAPSKTGRKACQQQITEDAQVPFRNLEIKSSELVLHFYGERTVIPLCDIENYRM